MRAIPVLLTGFTAIATVSAAPRIHVSTGGLTPESVVELVLDSPAAPGEVMGKPTAKEWLVIEPAWAGTTTWKDPSVIEFHPSEPPRLGVHYTFKVKEGHSYLDHTVIPAAVAGTADTEPFRMETAEQLNRYGDKANARRPRYLLRFNANVTPETAAPYLVFSTSSNSNPVKRVAAKTVRAKKDDVSSYYIRPSWVERFARRDSKDPYQPPTDPAAEISNALIVTPVQDLPEGKGWELSVMQKLPDAEGKLELAESSSQGLGDINPLVVNGVTARTEADSPRELVVSFNLKLAEKINPDLVEVTPKPADMKLEVKEFELHIRGDFSKENHWNVLIKPGLLSADGRVLATAYNKTVEFTPVRPELVVASQEEAQLASGARKYRVQTVNMEKVRVRVKKLEGAGVVRAQQGYRYYTGQRENEKNTDDTQPVPYEMMMGETIADFEIPLDNPTDTSRNLDLDWDKILAGYAKPYDENVKKQEAGPQPALKPAAAFFLELTGTPKKTARVEKDPDTYRTTLTESLVQLTDIGMAWKLTDGEAQVYVFSTLTGKPLDGVTLTAYGEDAKALQAVKTGANGMATLAREPKTRFLQAATASDSYTVSYDNSLATERLWRFPVRTNFYETTPENFRKVLLFTDRSLYRPGETMHLKGIVRRQQGNDIVASPGGKTQVAILDPTDKEISRQDVTVSERGSFDLSFAFPAETTGSFTVRLEYPDELAKLGNSGESSGGDEDDDDDAETAHKNGHLTWQEREEIESGARFTLPVRVEEFRRNAFEIAHEAQPVQPGAKEVSVKVKANSFQGQPLAKAKGEQYTQIAESNFYPEKYQDYQFGDYRQPDYYYWYHYFGYRMEDDSASRRADSTSDKFELAEDGTAVIAAKLPDTNFPMRRTVTINTQVTDANEQTLSESSEITVDPAAFYVGVKRVDRLIRVGDHIPLELIAVTTDEKDYTGDVTLEATTTREVNEQVRTSDGNGRDAVRNEARNEQLSKTTVTLKGGKGTQYLFAPSQPGKHQVELRGKDAQGREFATVTTYYVYGTDEYPWSYENGLQIKMVAEKQMYQPGETARVLVLSPIEGTALVTVEREKVLRSFTVELTTDKPVIEIPIKEGDAPNAFVSVLVIKGAKDSGRLFKEPQMRLGYCELTVNDTRDRLAVSLDTPKESVRPGEELALSGTVKLAGGAPASGAEVTLYAEDEGTLAVMGYETPKPMDYFYDPRVLRVNCGATLGQMLSESPENQTFYNKGFFVGGGDDELGSMKNLPRKDFNPCAVWLPALTTDAEGRFTAKFKLPDTLTRYRVIAIAAHDLSKFGTGESSVTVNKNLMVEPQELRFANEGDTLRVQANVSNASKTAGTWKIHFDAGAKVSEPIAALTDGTSADQTISLGAGESAVVAYPVHFGNTGETVFKWTAEPVTLQGASLTPELVLKHSDAVENRFTVNYPVPLMHQSKLVSLRDGQANLLEQMDPALVKGRGTVELEFSSSLLAEAGNSVDYLLHYPYGCVEQTTSSMMPWLAVERLRHVTPAFAKVKPEDVKKALQKGVDRLLTMNTQDGGFGYWPGDKESLPWASAYAGMGLMMAKEHGANVPDAVIEGLCQYLERSARGLGSTHSSYELEIATRNAWVLAMAGHQPDAYINVLKDRMGDLNERARCMLALAAFRAHSQIDPVSILRDKTAFKIQDDSWMHWEAGRPMTLLAWATIAPQAKETEEAMYGMLRDQDPYRGWRTTWVNAWALLGLDAYAAHDSGRGPASIALTTAEGTEQIELAHEGAPEPKKFTLTPSLKLVASADHGGYVRVKVSSKPDLIPSKPIAKNGLEITRLYERVNPDGSVVPLDVPKKGDLIRVTLKVEQPRDASRYLVVEDSLPSIFEAINSDFSSQAAHPNAGGTSEGSWTVSHSEIRADRVLFFFDYWYRGPRSLTYLARCTMEGKATAPPAKIESMYDPDSTALSASREF